MVEPRSRGQQPVSTPAARGSGRRVEVDPARLAAFDVLKTVRVDKAYTNLVLPAAISHYKLTGRDAAFTTELAAGTIRLRGTYDAIIAACSDRPMTKIEARVLDALRLGAHQLLSMRVPSHAAISTTVDLVHLRTGAGAAGFTNAVLRAVSEHDLDEWIARVAPNPRTAPTRHAAIAYSHPTWVIDVLRDAVGEAELTDLLAADNVAPAVTLVARPGRSTRDELPGEPTAYSPYGVVLAGGDPGAVPAVAEGRAGVQDEGSQLVATVLADAPLEGPDRRWLDLCAGPGGKSALLAGLAARARGRPWSPTSSSRTAPAWWPGRSAAPTGWPASSRRRHPAAVPRRQLRPGPGRRALHRARARSAGGPRRGGPASRTTWSPS